jgi:hypothetical protein
MIDKGMIEVLSDKDIHNRHKPFTILHKNDILGEMTLVGEEVFPTIVFALENCSLSVIIPKVPNYLIEK